MAQRASASIILDSCRNLRSENVSEGVAPTRREANDIILVFNFESESERELEETL